MQQFALCGKANMKNICFSISQSNVLCGLWHRDLHNVPFLKFIHSGHIHTSLWWHVGRILIL